VSGLVTRTRFLFYCLGLFNVALIHVRIGINLPNGCIVCHVRYGTTPSDRGVQTSRRNGETASAVNAPTLDRWEARGTLEYGAPEMINDHPSGMCKVFTTKADVWSAMLIVWESWAQRLWLGATANHKKSILSGTIPDVSGMPPFLAAITRYGLQYNDDKRPEASVSV
jgi:hypothetical protein